MRVGNGVYVLPIPRSPQEPESFLYLTLIVDEVNGNTLVDAGLPDQSGARVLAHPADAPHIDGSLRPLKPSPEMLEQRPQMREVLERLEPVGVDERLEDGAILHLVGGTKVISTPGHTPGH